MKRFTERLVEIALVLAVVTFVLLVALVPARSEPLTARSAAEILSSSVVTLVHRGSGFCTAFKIAPYTFITAGHCASNTGETLRVESGMTFLYVKSITSSQQEKEKGDRVEDWAILHTATDNENIGTLSLGCADELYLGMAVAYAGFPKTVDFAFDTGVVASVNPVEAGSSSNADFLVSLWAGPGASGSPILSLDTGRVIGILVEAVFIGDSRVNSFLIGVESVQGLDLCDGLTTAKDALVVGGSF